MRYLILSDIHANWEALEAVLRHAENSYETICCLGDVVGYGADPNAVTQWVRRNIKKVIRGNHDKVCCGLEDPVMFNPVARRAAEWTREALTVENRKYLRELAQGPAEVKDFLIVHGSVKDEDEYLLGPEEAALQFAEAPGRLVFFGHTHVQGGFVLRDLQSSAELDAPTDSPDAMHILPGQTYLMNPGSVGQPRDLRWQAAYALYDSKERIVEFRRCDYDIEEAQRKIIDAGLPPSLAQRLAEGR